MSGVRSFNANLIIHAVQLIINALLREGKCERTRNTATRRFMLMAKREDGKRRKMRIERERHLKHDETKWSIINTLLLNDLVYPQ